MWKANDYWCLCCLWGHLDFRASLFIFELFFSFAKIPSICLHSGTFRNPPLDLFLIRAYAKRAPWPSWATGTVPLGLLCRAQLHKLQSLVAYFSQRVSALCFHIDLIWGPPSLCHGAGTEPEFNDSVPPLEREAFSLDWANYLDSVLLRDEIFLSRLWLLIQRHPGLSCHSDEYGLCLRWGPTSQNLMSMEIEN